MTVIDQVQFPHLARIAAELVAVWPEHERYLEQSFAGRDGALLRSSNHRAEIILRIVGATYGLDRYCRDYRFMCDKFLEEEVYFRRHGRYRLSRFEDALAEVYSNRELMDRYLNFILLTHVLWDNHARAMAHFESQYLSSLPAGTDHLEIGPGHGLLLHFASLAPAVASITGWDVSQTSIDRARHCLAALGEKRPVDLVLRDLFAAPDAADGRRRFGSVVLSEVLEHLENPVAALKGVARHMKPGAFLWIHVPINSPAPDHIYLLRTPEEAVELARSGGFVPTDWAFYPMTGQTLERARKRSLTISAVVTARLPD
jgi:2-polyprenyl-3-methyl-5-hydroxy-6-metoxy-1,4-benzoquinol methylase